MFKSSVRVTVQTPDPLGEASCVCCLWSYMCVYSSILPHLMQAWNTWAYLSKNPFFSLVWARHPVLEMSLSGISEMSSVSPEIFPKVFSCLKSSPTPQNHSDLYIRSRWNSLHANVVKNPDHRLRFMKQTWSSNSKTSVVCHRQFISVSKSQLK